MYEDEGMKAYRAQLQQSQLDLVTQSITPNRR